MIRNLSMKIGEGDSGSARLLCAATSPIFMLEFLIIWSLLEGVHFGWRLLGRRPIKGMILFGDQTIWRPDHAYETDVLTPDVQARDVVPDYLNTLINIMLQF